MLESYRLRLKCFSFSFFPSKKLIDDLSDIMAYTCVIVYIFVESDEYCSTFLSIHFAIILNII